MALTPRTSLPKQRNPVRYAVGRPPVSVFPKDPKLEMAMKDIYNRKKAT